MSNRISTLDELNKKTTGTGLFLLENKTKGDIVLPKRSQDGKLIIPPKGRFRGDSYLLEAVRSEVTLIEDLSMHVERVLTEVPPCVTSHGEVAFVEKHQTLAQSKDVLLCEHPIDGVTIID